MQNSGQRHASGIGGGPRGGLMGLLFMFLFALAMGGAFLWVWLYAIRQMEP